MILIGIGSNLAAAPAKTPLETAEAGLGALRRAGIRVAARSGWYLSEPVPVSDQPWFANAVVIAESNLAPVALLDRLQAIEADFGRVRTVRNAPRTLDLDLLDHDAFVCDTETLTLPHPRLHERRFVLAPLCEIAPAWRHPHFGLSATELLARLPLGQPVLRVDD
jgi:2-amino-4-hydroxy-6-hydroxymethyldihydropteridine diphosphokinase